MYFYRPGWLLLTRMLRLQRKISYSILFTVAGTDICIRLKDPKRKEDKIMSIRIGILGYGNLGRGVECAVKHNPDMELKAVFTRRDPSSLSLLTEGVKYIQLMTFSQ